MEIVDARDAFFKRNKSCLQAYLRQRPVSQAHAIQLLPLLFQVNSRLLPGYNGPDVPYGIYDYAPEKTALGLARKLNARFHMDQTAVLKNAPIEAIYFKHSALHNTLSLCLIYAAGLTALQQVLLEEKLYRVNAWLRSRDLTMQTHLVSAGTLLEHGMYKNAKEYFAAYGLFLDAFYAESFLLAGKYPVWWLIPPELEAHHTDFIDKIKIARFVNEQEYIDLGAMQIATPYELMKQAMDCVHGVQQSPETSWAKLLILNIVQKNWPLLDGMAIRLKQHIYLDDMKNEITADNMLREMLLEALQDLKNADHNMPIDRLLSSFKQYFPENVVISGLLQVPDTKAMHLKPQAFDAMRYIQTNRALMREISLVFEKIVSRFKRHADDEASQQLLSLAQNMRLFLSEPPQRIPVLIARAHPKLLQERVIFRHVIKPVDKWMLCIESADEQEKILYEATGLLSLIAWAWLNHVVDKSTQVAVECPIRSIKQIDARYALEVMINQLDGARIIETPREAFIKTREMQAAVVFIHVMLDESLRAQLESIEDESANEKIRQALKLESLIGHCEQLVVSNWGDVQVQRFSGEAGVVHCLCDWLMCGLALPKPTVLPLQVFGYAPGASTWLAQRTSQIYEQMAAFFFKKRSCSARFIVRIGQHYYCVQLQDAVFYIDPLGDETALLQFLELPSEQFIETGFERMSMPVMPLHEIYLRNKPGAVQLFYRVSTRVCDTWLLDEKGSLCHFRQDGYERDDYLTHWLYLLRNVRKRMKNINYQSRELPVLELNRISNNRLGEIEFNKINPDSLNAQRNFIDVQIQAIGVNNNDKLSLVCDGKHFDYSSYADSVLTEALRYIQSRRSGEAHRPVFVTDVDVPLRLFNVEQRDNIQTIHFLKYVKNFENRIIQLLGSL